MTQILTWSGLILAMAPFGWAQSFEVVSIRPSATDSRRAIGVFPGGRFTATAMTLRSLIMSAYNVGPQLLTGTSGWMDSERLDVAGKAPEGLITSAAGRPAEVAGSGAGANWTALDPNSPDTKVFRQMMQTMLADRFQLKIHRETRELPAYSLMVAKGGPRLAEAKSGSLRMNWGLGQVAYQGAPLSMLTNTLTQLTGRLVLDQTGLTGAYDFTLKWTPDDGQMQIFRRTGDGTANSEAAAPDAASPSLFTALKEQLGLRLEATKAPVEMLVVDHAERASEN